MESKRRCDFDSRSAFVYLVCWMGFSAHGANLLMLKVFFDSTMDFDGKNNVYPRHRVRSITSTGSNRGDCDQAQGHDRSHKAERDAL